MRRYFWFLTALTLVFSGCSKNSNSFPTIRYGKDHCAECKMVISEELFASALVKTNGETEKFDDLGCLIRFRSRLNPDEVKGAWVHDYESGAWLRLEETQIVHASDLLTPMGYSLAAFRDLSSAQVWAGEHHGEIIQLDQYQSSIMTGGVNK